ncbi:aldehyde dehydrogenase family protein [Paraglaciecola polaris]|uniref:aldehyde dehydrogenase family protein n=1 Tax=Paraglaciecola polaris TaxID=222814 RepID=UPI0030EF0E12|tara:strand:+ start:19865 stop:21283 length:1419 start_codon:yes stop_codon:yes gene_type:complete
MSNNMQTMAISNPRTGLGDFDLPLYTLQHVADEAKRLKLHQSQWWNMGLGERIAVMQNLANSMAEYKAHLVAALINDTGRASESELEVDVTINAIHRWCKQVPALLAKGEPWSAEIPFIELQQDYLPYPLVGVISPWNFPLLLSLVDAIPALLAGSAVLIKPSEVTSRFVAPFNEVLKRIPMLNNVLTLVTGAGETGQAVINAVDSLCFTGSVATGRHVGQLCAQRFIPAFLELGGKDPAIVCKDADPELAAKALCWGSMVNAGQSCMSLERVYVHKDIAPIFLAKLVANVRALKHNYPDIQQGQIGPIISAKQVKIVEAQLQDAKDKGATILCGGEVLNLGGGRYCLPTVLTDVNPQMSVVSQETFAAVLPVTIIDSDEQGVVLANDSEFGLSAAVFSQNVDYAKQIARQLEAGAVSINDASLTALIHEAEKQSFKYSGLGGSRMGAESIRRFMRKKAYIRNTGVPSPWWF